MYYVLYTLYAIVFCVSIYTISLPFVRLVADRKYDSKLAIHTTGIRDWDKDKIYNRTESTPYLALNSFANKYKMSPEDSLVDFGCGKGRVAIFMHNKLNINVTGIELNELTYDEAIDNIKIYSNKYPDLNKDLYIGKEYAQKYQIKENENKFFFFNPFDVSIFTEVVSNIIHNSNKYNKEVEIILYYPLSSYKHFLNSKTPFILTNKISAKCSIGFKEKFLIYKYTPEII